MTVVTFSVILFYIGQCDQWTDDCCSVVHVMSMTGLWPRLTGHAERWSGRDSRDLHRTVDSTSNLEVKM